MSDDQRPSWNLHGLCADLVHDDALRASIDLAKPADGLRVAVPGLASGLAVLRLALPPLYADDAARRLDSFVRGPDLVATYADTPRRDFRTQVYWRHLPDLAADAALAVELIVSLQTELLDAQPELCVESTLSSAVVAELTDVQLEDAAPPRIRPIETPPGSRRTLRSPAHSGALLTQLGDDWSYLEAVHPLDFQETVVSRSSEPSRPGVEWRHRLLAHRLEKGVILRSRILGVLLRRRNDLSSARRCYSWFAGSALPLTA